MKAGGCKTALFCQDVRCNFRLRLLALRCPPTPYPSHSHRLLPLGMQSTGWWLGFRRRNETCSFEKCTWGWWIPSLVVALKYGVSLFSWRGDGAKTRDRDRMHSTEGRLCWNILSFGTGERWDLIPRWWFSCIQSAPSTFCFILDCISLFKVL